MDEGNAMYLPPSLKPEGYRDPLRNIAVTPNYDPPHSPTDEASPRKHRNRRTAVGMDGRRQCDVPSLAAARQFPAARGRPRIRAPDASNLRLHLPRFRELAQSVSPPVDHPH